MIHLTTIFWAQLILIGIGSTFQLIALRFLSRDPEIHYRIRPHAREHRALPAEEKTTALPVEPRPAKPFQPYADNMLEETPTDIRPGDLLRTARVSFVRNFRVHK